MYLRGTTAPSESMIKGERQWQVEISRAWFQLPESSIKYCTRVVTAAPALVVAAPAAPAAPAVDLLVPPGTEYS